MTKVFESADTAQSASKLRWGRIVGGAFLLELVLGVVLVPPLQILGPEKVIPLVAPACFIFGFLVTWWLLRQVQNRRVVHGMLIGILATAIYVLACFANPDGFQSVIDMYGMFGFIAANALRILGSMAGGYISRPQTS